MTSSSLSSNIIHKFDVSRCKVLVDSVGRQHVAWKSYS